MAPPVKSKPTQLLTENHDVPTQLLNPDRKDNPPGSPDRLSAVIDPILAEYAASESFSGSSVSAATLALTKLVKASRSSGGLPAHLRTDPRFKSLCSHLVILAQKEGQLDVESMMVCSWALANLSVHPPGLREAMVKLVKEQGARLSPQGLSNFLWIISRSNPPASEEEKRVAQDLAQVAMGKLGTFRGSELASLLWGFAKQKFHHPELFAAAERHAVRLFGELRSQHLANLAWAYATLKIPAPALFHLLSQLSQEALWGFRPQELSMLAWAFGTQGTDTNAKEIFRRISRVAQARIDLFTPQGLSMLMWAFGKVGFRDEVLFDRVCQHARDNITLFTPAELGAIIWTLSETRHPHPPLLSQVEQLFLSNPGAFSSLELAALARALSLFGEVRQETFFAIEERIMQPAGPRDPGAGTLLGSLPTDGLVYIAWAFSKAGVRSEPLLHAISATASERAEHLSSRQIAELLLPFGELQTQPGDLVSKITAVLVSKKRELDDLKPTQLADIAWSLAVTEANSPPLFSMIGQKVFQNFEQFSPTELSTLSWAFEVAGSEPDLASLIVAMSQDSQTG